jgi:DNA-binding XRE family transcriptional regulator
MVYRIDGVKLRARRIERGMSQQDLGYAAQVSQQVVSAAENAKHGKDFLISTA